MTEEWQVLTRFALYVLIIVLALTAISRLFGVNDFLKSLRAILKAEFTKVSGIISFLSTLAFGYFITNPTLFTYLTRFASPPSYRQDSLHSNIHIDQTIVWAFVLVILGNFVIIAILGLHDNKSN